MTFLEWQQFGYPAVFLLLAYWRQDSWLYALSGSAFVYLGIVMVPTNFAVAVMMIAIGSYTVVRGFLAGRWR